MSEIKKRFSTEILFQDENKTLIKLVEENKADLSEANLSGADLFGANLSGADLFRANLKEIENYTESHQIRIQLCARLHTKFTQKEKAFIFEFIAISPCWNSIKENYGKTALSVFKKFKDAGWGEYYDRYIEIL